MTPYSLRAAIVSCASALLVTALWAPDARAESADVAGAKPAGSPDPAAAQATTPSGVRVGLGAGALYVPASDGDVTAWLVHADLVFPTQSNWETRLIAYGYQVDATATKTTGAMLALHSTIWASVYGFGFGGGLGYAAFSKQGNGGWDDDSLSLAAYVTPVTLRFGDKPRVEISANIGAIRFFAHDVRPWGFVGLGLVL